MELKELERLLKLCHRYKVRSITIGDTSLVLDSIVPPKQKASKETPEEKPQVEYSEEDILLWSSTSI
jgi:hypothetical protein